MNTHDSEPLPAVFDRNEMASYLRGNAVDIMFNLPELENMDAFDMLAKTVEVYLKHKGIV